jgi:hypothetical protein
MDNPPARWASRADLTVPQALTAVRTPTADISDPEGATTTSGPLSNRLPSPDWEECDARTRRQSELRDG